MRYAVLFLSLFFACIPALLYAQGLVPCDGLRCQFCHFGTLIQNVINFLILLSIPIAAIFFLWAGFLFFSSAGDSGKLEKGKTIFIDVLIGLVIALAAWLIVNTLLSFTVSGQFSAGWNSLEKYCVAQSVRDETIFGNTLSITTGISGISVQPEGTPPGSRCTNVDEGTGRCNNWQTIGGVTYFTPGGRIISEEERRKELVACMEEGGCHTHEAALLRFKDEGKGITVTSSGSRVDAECGSIAYGCTSVHGLRNATVQMVLDYNRECDCPLVITGGTERDGHARVYGPGQHIYGDKVDFAHTRELDTWFIAQVNEKRFVNRGSRSATNGGTYTFYCDTKTGNVWTVEKGVPGGNHYDVRAGGC